jgi:dihydropyrimidinase
VHHLATSAELTGAHIYTVHTSCAEAVAAAVAARRRGVNVWIEAVAPHLVLDKTYAERDGFEGAKYVMSPPLRNTSNQPALWNALRAREISTIGTDHAPFSFGTQKIMGRDAFTKIPNGIPSVQERVDLVHTFGVKSGRIDYHAFVDACSAQAARIFGLYPRKGTVRVGSDADLVVYDPDHQRTLSVETSLSAVDYNAFEGWAVTGCADVVTVRGKVQARAGAFIGDQSRGVMLEREPTHF